MNGFLKQISLWLILFLIGALALMYYSDSRQPTVELKKQDFEQELERENIAELSVTNLGEEGFSYEAEFKEPVENQERMKFEWHTFPDDWEEMLAAQGVDYSMERDSTMMSTFLINMIPLLLIIGLFWFFMFRHMQGGNNKAMSFGKSKAKLVNHSEQTVTFNDVSGVDEAKEELQEVVEFLKDPQKFTRLGGKIPKGVLLVGPPGTGKTLLGRAVAGEANAPFFSISGSDFVEMFVGVGASRVRDLFQQGQKHAPCILFIDELDAVGRQRGAGLGGGHDEREQTLNQLLVEMDGFNTSDGVILMAATNRPDVLDRALLRPGRFDRQIVVPNPDVKGREKILEVHVKGKNIPMEDEVNLQTLARGTSGFSGADLANMVNEAALLAARREHENVTMQDFEDAKDRVTMGPERRSLVLSPQEKRNTAYHEAGHVLVGRFLPNTDPIHKVTIIPRGPSLGLTSMIPTEDRYSLSKSYCLSQLRVLMGGRAAEDTVFGEFTSGAANDLKVATDRAHAMVCEWGMSELGPVSFGGSNGEVFLGRDFVKERNYSEETASAVDKTVHKLLDDAYGDVKQMMLDHKEILVALAEALYERETLEAYEIDEIIRAHGGEHLLPPKPEQEQLVSGQKEEGAVSPAPGSEMDDENASGMEPGDPVPDGA
ncbi:MAG: ATP-dependent zinc metalloprotease FtsH [Candidatus Hydrogenedentota bacterium]